MRAASLSTSPLALPTGELVLVTVKAGHDGGEVIVKRLGVPTTQKATLSAVAAWVLATGSRKEPFK